MKHIINVQSNLNISHSNVEIGEYKLVFVLIIDYGIGTLLEFNVID